MNEITNLTKEQIFGNDRLEIFNYIDTKAAVTDFAVLSGAFVSNCYANDSDRTLANRTGFYWLNNSCDNNACAVGYLGNMVVQRVSNRVMAFRPAMLLSDILGDVKYKDINADVARIQYGLYPQKAFSASMQRELEKAYEKGLIQLRLTRSIYTVDARKWYEVDKDFSPKTMWVYRYNDKRYVRMIANSCFNDEHFQLSNKKFYRNYDAVWVEVEPVNWLVDKKTGVVISEKLLFGGIPFSYSKEFMNEYFLKELTQPITITQTKPVGRSRTLKK